MHFTSHCVHMVLRQRCSTGTMHTTWYLLVSGITAVGIVFERLGKDAGVREGASNGEGVPDHGPLRLPPHGQHLARIVDQTDQMHPLCMRGRGGEARSGKEVGWRGGKGGGVERIRRRGCEKRGN